MAKSRKQETLQDKKRRIFVRMLKRAGMLGLVLFIVLLTASLLSNSRGFSQDSINVVEHSPSYSVPYTGSGTAEVPYEAPTSEEVVINPEPFAILNETPEEQSESAMESNEETDAAQDSEVTSTDNFTIDDPDMLFALTKPFIVAMTLLLVLVVLLRLLA